MLQDRTTTVVSPMIRNVAAAVAAAGATSAAILGLGRATQTVEQHGALVVGFAASAVIALWLLPGDRNGTRRWAIGGIAATVVVAVALGGLLSQPTSVNENVVTVPDTIASTTTGTATNAAASEPVLLSRGSFEPLEHAGRGTASLIRTPDGKTVLTLTGFATDAGPDLDVRLVAGNPSSDSDVEAGETLRLGKLKGTSGDQQYVLPADIDPAQFTHAYIWCRAFSVGFTRAQLV
jgi:hypothetical protein